MLPDTCCEPLSLRAAALPNACAIIFSSPGIPFDFSILCDAGRSIQTMGVDRFIASRRAIFFLSILIGFPGAARSATMEDSARELARKIVAALPTRDNASCDIRNQSSLRPDEKTQIEQTIKSEFLVEGVHSVAGPQATSVTITLSENWRELVWTAEIGSGDTSRVIVLAVPRNGAPRAASNAMHVTVRSEKFWDGPGPIVDAVEMSNGQGQSWLVLLTPSALAIENLQAGSSSKVAIEPEPSNIRDPWGQLGPIPQTNEVWFQTSSQMCKVNLDASGPPQCLSEEELRRPLGGRFPFIVDGAPAGPLPPGKGLALVIPAVCGGTDQFLATSARDYTQPDTVQIFQTEQSGPVPMSGELGFPGPILALHTAIDAPRAIVRNLSTGNYEAYRLAISCGE